MTDAVGNEFVSIYIEGQLFGIPVLQVQDVLGPSELTAVPLAPSEVAGVLNLRGRIVTAIDVRRRLGLPERSSDTPAMSIVVDLDGEPYSLLIDSVGEVLTISPDGLEPCPATLSARWREVSSGIHRQGDQLLVILQVDRLLDFSGATSAAA